MICKRLHKDGAYDKLIETGIRLFGTYGYDSVSIRQISKDAKVNIAAVCYYFGSKKKFYEEVVRYLTHEISISLDTFDIEHFRLLPVDEAKITLIKVISQYQDNFISDHGINRLNIFMHEAFGNSRTEAANIYTEALKHTYDFFNKILTIYFARAGKDPSLIKFSIALIHGIIQAYVITKKDIAPQEIKLDKDVLLKSIEIILV